MSGIFSAIGIAGTGITVNRKWMDAIADNLSNINNASPISGEAFQTRYVIARARWDGSGTGGTEVAGIALSGNTAGRIVFEPDHPLADEEGYVRYPEIDLGSQMSQLIMAQRAYQSNLTVADRARDAYTAAIQLGRNA